MDELNLIPYSLKQKRQKRYEVRQYFAFGIIVLCTLFAGVYFPSLHLISLRVQENELLAKVNENNTILEESKLISSEIASYNQRLQLIDNLSKNKIMVSERIRDIQKYMPKDIILSNLEYTKDGVTITGNCINYNAVCEFTANLQASKKYKSADITTITGDNSQSMYNFSIRISY